MQEVALITVRDFLSRLHKHEMAFYMMTEHSRQLLGSAQDGGAQDVKGAGCWISIFAAVLVRSQHSCSTDRDGQLAGKDP